MTNISCADDVIDSRDVIKRIEELEEMRQDAMSSATKDNRWEAPDECHYCGGIFDESDYEELQALKALADEADGYSDWEHGATLIHEDHFENYATQFAEDLGLIKADMQWPYTCIDWGQAADELKADYSAVDFCGNTYYIRD